MTQAAGGGSGGGRGRGALGWIGVGLLVVVVLLVIGAPSSRSDRPFDPTSPGPRGSKAVVVLLRELGAAVTVGDGRLGPADDTALLLRDRLDEEGTEALADWVDDGGVLVVADPFSSLFGEGTRSACPAALDDVATLALGPEPSDEIDRGARCFGGLVRSADRGDGTIVSIEDPRVFTNATLDDDDNAVLAAALLAPTGEERFTFVVGSAGGGDEALFDLLGPRVAQGIAQLAVAAVLFALWQSRRLGRAVVEPQPVAIAGSELVAAVGRLQESRQRPAEAADTVRVDLRRALERRLGIGSADVERMADAVAAQTGLPPERVLAALDRRIVTDDATLLEVLDDLDRIRVLTLAPRAPSPGGPR